MSIKSFSKPAAKVVPPSGVFVPSVVIESVALVVVVEVALVVVVTPVQAGSLEQVGAGFPFKKRLA